MKKKLIGVTVVVAIVIVAGWNYNQSKNRIVISNLALANVEALAVCEKTAGSCWLDLRSVCCDAGDIGCAPCDD